MEGEERALGGYRNTLSRGRKRRQDNLHLHTSVASLTPSGLRPASGDSGGSKDISLGTS